MYIKNIKLNIYLQEHGFIRNTPYATYYREDLGKNAIEVELTESHIIVYQFIYSVIPKFYFNEGKYIDELVLIEKRQIFKKHFVSVLEEDLFWLVNFNFPTYCTEE